MTCAKFESVIGFHCSPVLLGIKPANLVSLVKDDAGMPAASLMQHYKRKLAKHGVSILPLCERERQTVILVYREDLLTETLQCPKKQKILDKIGYPAKGNVQELLFHLRGRFTDPTEFPHEIGLFLGYPLEDVEGFCRKKGADCKPWYVCTTHCINFLREREEQSDEQSSSDLLVTDRKHRGNGTGSMRRRKSSRCGS